MDHIEGYDPQEISHESFEGHIQPNSHGTMDAASEYSYTGKNIPVNMDDVIRQVVRLLQSYDQTVATGQSINFNPYNEIIIMRKSDIGQTDDDKLFEVPREIQTEAIKQWTDFKVAQEKQKTVNIETQPAQIKLEQTTETPKHISRMLEKRKKREVKKDDEMIHFIVRLIGFIIFLLVVVYLCKYMKY